MNDFAKSEKAAVYREKLYQELGRISHWELSDTAVEHILVNFPDWQLTTAKLRDNAVKVLRRNAMAATVTLEDDRDHDRRRLIRSKDSIAIVMKKVTGADLRLLIDIEKKIPPAKLAENKTSRNLGVEFKFASNKLKAGEYISDREAILLSTLTKCATIEAIADCVDTSPSTVSRTLKPARERLDAETYIDLMLIAIAAQLADTDHVPAGKTEYLSIVDKQFIAQFYSPNSQVKSKIRSQPVSTNSPRWSRIYDKLDLDDRREARHLAVLYCVQDKVVQLPQVKQLTPQLPESYRSLEN